MLSSLEVEVSLNFNKEKKKEEKETGQGSKKEGSEIATMSWLHSI